MDWITQPETWIAFLTLVALELILGVDNVIGFDCLMISEMSSQFRELSKRNKPGKSRRYGNY